MKVCSTIALYLTTWVLGARVPSAAAITGYGPTSLSNEIDQEIQQLLTDEDIVGMTVAVTKGGRLVYSKGFGHSKLGSSSTSMQPTDRTRIGSVSKAIVSGPATSIAMMDQQMDQATTTLYGSGGLFGDRYKAYIRTSNKRFNPIISMAINKNNKVYTWFRDGTVSVGTAWDLEYYNSRRSFTVAPGKELKDLHAVGITPTDKVYAWYKDGSLSIGQSRNLGNLVVDAEGETRHVSFPIGPDGDRKSMSDVVDIDIAKSDSHVYIWYDDGTCSSGTRLDFDYYWSNRSYESPVIDGADMRYRIRGIGIAANDRIYTWIPDQYMIGWSQDLDFYRSLRDYSIPETGWDRYHFSHITVQDLFDHRSGFTRSGDVEATKRLFPYDTTASEDPSHDLIHKHFLETRPLLSEPGTSVSYSNHGMGLTTLVIEEVTGSTYRSYTTGSYLASMGLNGRIRPQHAVPDGDDAFPYERQGNDDHKLLSFKNSGAGLAAGGWTASAPAVVAVTSTLAERHGYEFMDAAGFFRRGKGKLSHNGSTGGGYAVVAVFPAGYTANDGTDLSDIHVAINCNTSELKKGAGGRISDLASLIAVATGKANLPGSLDYFGQVFGIRTNP